MKKISRRSFLAAAGLSDRLRWFFRKHRFLRGKLCCFF